MNKLFPLHTQVTGPDFYRQYYRSTWEPIAINSYYGGFIPFQYYRVPTEYFYCGQVINGVTTDITSKFRSGTELITSWTPGTYATLSYNSSDYTITSLSIDAAYVGEAITSNNFSLSANDYFNFRIDGTVGTGDSFNIIFRKGATVLGTDLLNNGKSEIAYKVVTAGSDYNVQIDSMTVAPPAVTLNNAVYSAQKCKYEITNNYVTHYDDLLYSEVANGVCTFNFQSSTKLYSDVCYVTNDTTFFNKQIRINISSLIDYAGIYYEGGFTQRLYIKSNVRRSPEPKITVIGDERNGIIVREKVITATRYKVKIRCNEEQMDALTAAASATVQIVDQTGRVFTCNNLEVDKPDWYGTNGLVTLSFDDNINVFTQNI